MVGVYVVSEVMGRGGSLEAEMAISDEALKLFQPRHAADLTELLSSFRSASSPHNGAYLTGRKDADLYMAWKLFNLAPQAQGKAALDRLLSRLRLMQSAR